MLVQFTCNIEHGVDIKSHLNNSVFKSDIAIEQLLQYNCYNKCTYGATTHRHSKDRPNPFAVYIGMTVCWKTQKRQLIDMIHENGISISYDMTVLDVSALLGESVVNQYVADGVECPPSLRKGLFTTSAMDNIEHNPTATTANSPNTPESDVLIVDGWIHCRHVHPKRLTNMQEWIQFRE